MENEFTNEVLTREELLILVKELLIAIHLVCENDFAFTQYAINHGQSYGAKTLFECSQFMATYNITSLNLAYRDIMEYLNLSEEILFNEILNLEEENEF